MLDYLFVAELHNGEIIQQSPLDASTIDPLKRSAFYDVTQQKSPVQRFSLVGKGHMITIDLMDGHAEVDGRVIYPPKKPPEKSTLELIYYRQVQQKLVSKIMVRPDGMEVEEKTLEPVLRYYIGWQTHYKGKNYKFELGID